jgi:hypothetical protein
MPKSLPARMLKSHSATCSVIMHEKLETRMFAGRRKMVDLGRVELPANGLGIGRLFLNLNVFSAFGVVDFVLF